MAVSSLCLLDIHHPDNDQNHDGWRRYHFRLCMQREVAIRSMCLVDEHDVFHDNHVQDHPDWRRYYCRLRMQREVAIRPLRLLDE
jgi:hypothetical protein